MADRVNSLLAELRRCTVANCGTCKRRESSAACDGLVREAADVLQEVCRPQQTVRRRDHGAAGAGQAGHEGR